MKNKTMYKKYKSSPHNILEDYSNSITGRGLFNAKDSVEERLTKKTTRKSYLKGYRRLFK